MFGFVTGGMAMLTLVRMESGWGALFFLFGCCWQADNGALFVGSALGSLTPQFLPTVSPKKTYAGVVGALLFSAGSGYAYVYLAALAEEAAGSSSSSSFAGSVSTLVPPLPFSDPVTAAAVGLLLGITAIVVCLSFNYPVVPQCSLTVSYTHLTLPTIYSV